MDSCSNPLGAREQQASFKSDCRLEVIMASPAANAVDMCQRFKKKRKGTITPLWRGQIGDVDHVMSEINEVKKSPLKQTGSFPSTSPFCLPFISLSLLRFVCLRTRPCVHFIPCRCLLALKFTVSRSRSSGENVAEGIMRWRRSHQSLLFLSFVLVFDIFWLWLFEGVKAWSEYVECFFSVCFSVWRWFGSGSYLQRVYDTATMRPYSGTGCFESNANISMLWC